MEYIQQIKLTLNRIITGLTSFLRTLIKKFKEKKILKKFTTARLKIIEKIIFTHLNKKFFF